MADGNQAFHDGIVRRRIALDNLSQKQTRELTKFLKEAEKDLIAKIANLPENAVKARAAQTKLLENLKDLYEDAYSNVQSGLERNLKALAGSEAKTYADGIAQHAHNGSGVTVTTQQLSASAAYSIATSTPMQGRFVNKSIRELPKLQRDRIEQQLRIGFAQGESLGSIKKRISGMTGTNATHLESFIRTANTHIASQVQRASNELNKDLIQYEVYSVVLDSRTSRICMGLSGKKYKVGEGPYPPMHFRCRSVRYPVLVGSDPPKEENYQQWISRQPASVQDDILGPSRANLLRQGGVTVDRFTNSRGKTLPLEQITSKADDLAAANYERLLVERQEALFAAEEAALKRAAKIKADKEARTKALEAQDANFVKAVKLEQEKYERAAQRAKEIAALSPEARAAYQLEVNERRKRVMEAIAAEEAEQAAKVAAAREAKLNAAKADDYRIGRERIETEVEIQKQKIAKETSAQKAARLKQEADDEAAFQAKIDKAVTAQAAKRAKAERLQKALIAAKDKRNKTWPNPNNEIRIQIGDLDTPPKLSDKMQWRWATTASERDMLMLNDRPFVWNDALLKLNEDELLGFRLEFAKAWRLKNYKTLQRLIERYMELLV